jgi:hypothetical protein
MRLECKNAQVTLTWDNKKTMEIIVRNQNGDVLLVQTQGEGGSMTNIHDHSHWDEVIV